MAELCRTTPARIGIGRAGTRYETEAWLKFRMDHAAARDTIFHPVGDELIAALGAVPLESRAGDRQTYLLRPDLGRRLSPESEVRCRAECRPGAAVQALVVDGLSGRAVEAGALDFLRAFTLALPAGCVLGTPIFVRLGRVAVMDHVGEILQPELIVELVGERPGLVTAESMSAYFCYKPRLGRIESDRSLISNIHLGGIPAVEAGVAGARLAERILAAGASGVKLG
jgi:ethanolamine ammonia-lyase small subunit